ncbi:MAG: hypothetical protein MPN21_00925 [Thermoanaerobaculia bacterium]|nr:hypothetical protein [Thermoanaerobaculia bacterium]
MYKAGKVVAIGFGFALIGASSVHGEPVPVGEPFQVNIYTTSWQDAPSVAATDSGNFLIFWESRGQDGEFEGIYGRRYDSSGMPQTGEMPVNSFTASSQGGPKALVGPQGPVVVWRDGAFDGDSGSIMVKLVGDDEFLVNTHTTGNHMFPDLAMDAQGDFVVVWDNDDDQDGDGRGVFAQRFDSAGGLAGSEFQVNTTTTGFQELPAVDGIGDGRFVVVWNADAGSDDRVMAQRFASDGSKQGAEITVNAPSYDRNDPDVAMATDGSFVVVWKSYVDPTYEIYSRRFDSNGDPTTTGLPVASTPGVGGYQPSIRRDPDGDFLVLWNDGAGALRMRRLSADGVAAGAGTTVAPGGFDAEIAFTDSADYAGLVTWVEVDTDGDSLGIFARRVVESQIFVDGFELGNTSAWSVVTP